MTDSFGDKSLCPNPPYYSPKVVFCVRLNNPGNPEILEKILEILENQKIFIQKCSGWHVVLGARINVKPGIRGHYRNKSGWQFTAMNQNPIYLLWSQISSHYICQSQALFIRYGVPKSNHRTRLFVNFEFKIHYWVSRRSWTNFYYEQISQVSWVENLWL